MSILSASQVKSQLIVPPHYEEQKMLNRKLKRESKRIDERLKKQKSKWSFRGSPMTIKLHQDAGSIPGGLVLSVPHEVGRMLLHKRMAAIIEHDVTVDADITDNSLEDFIAAMEGLD